MDKKIVNKLEDLKVVATDFLFKLEMEEGKATVLGLSGDLGAGKTTFVQYLAKELGIEESVNSPTFNIMKRYETTHDKYKYLVHMDVYRLESTDELNPLRFGELLAESETLICIEWSDKVADALPERTVKLHFDINQDNLHTIQSVQ